MDEVTLRIEVVEAVCATTLAVNEDAWGAAGGAVWVLDGATGVGERQHLGGASDAAWLAAAVSGELAAQLGSGGDLAAGLAQAVAQAAGEAARRAALHALPKGELPSASFVAVQLSGRRLRALNLGDCKLAWRRPGEAVQLFGTSGVGVLDAQMEAMLAQAAAAGVSLADRRIAARALAREQRALMNTPEGYWILDLSGAGLPHAEDVILDEGGDLDLMLMSDGFYRLVELYGAHSYETLFAAAEDRGLSALYADLRAIEAADPECLRYARNKVSDDATAVFCRVRAG